jgi:hypothetical protein
MKKQELKQLLEDNFKHLSQLSVKEYTLYRKYTDIKEKYPIVEDPFFGVDTSQYDNILKIKDMLWVPESVNDYLNLEPEMVFVDNKENSFIWNTLRDFCHSAHWNQSPGRLLRFYIRDKVSGKILGFNSLGSDFIGVGGRDKYIGWTTEDKLKGGRLRHTAMGSTIASVQPFGFNYNGGKLIALLTASQPVQDKWFERYKDTLVGVTTTSLYGSGSMYDRLKYWRKCKATTGQISIEPSEDVYLVIKKWYKENYPEQYKNDVSGSHPKVKVLSSIYRLLDVKPPVNNAPRGVYWNELYDNTKDFLCRKTDELGDKKYNSSVEALTELWKERYAKKRVENLTKQNRFSDHVLFYDDMIYNDWECIKKKYLC